MIIPFFLSFIIRYIIALVAIAFYTLIERKLLGYFQLRKGPNKPSLSGIPQPFADAIKLFTKEQSYPTPANRAPFIVAPVLGLILTLLLWAIYPHSNPAIFLSFGALYFLCVSRINVYTTFLAGWCSNSKYALLGALRGVAQTISYEVSISLILLSSLIINQTIDMSIISINLISWIILIISPLALIWFITNLAETNRTPFDFAEGESELVSGFNTEYRRGIFALIFIAEYANILIISLLTRIFFSGYSPLIINFSLVIKTILIATLFVWIRATLPRIRYDNLIYLTWKTFLPIRLSSLIIIFAIIHII
jgi:NADH-ubiquinone oxidoreductase chain 1